MTFSFDEDLQLALTLADAADVQSMARYRASDLRVETKPDLTPVTEADQAVEKLIRDALATQRPDDLIVGEEFGGDAALTPVRRWIVDPIDGTKNYVRGVPVWATLISLVDAEGPAVGVVSAPALGRRWWAIRGGAAYTRDVDGSTREIRVSAVSNIGDASFSYSDAVGWDRHGDAGPRALNTLIADAWRTRGYGDFLSHMLVAEGAVDIAAEPQLAPWDVAALVPIVQAAGGRMTGYDGRSCIESGSGLTTNGHLHAYALDLFR